MKRKAVILFLLIDVILDGPVLAQDEQPDSPSIEVAKDVIRRFNYAIWDQDLGVLKSVCSELEGLERLIDPKNQMVPRNEEFRKRLEANLSIEEYPGIADFDETRERKIFRVDFGGMYMPIHAIRVGDEWMVDPRWWIAKTLPSGEPEEIAKRFLVAMFAQNPEDLESITAPNEQIWALTSEPTLPPADLRIVVEDAEYMPLVRLRKGETYRVASGPIREVSAEQCMEDRMLLVGLFGPGEFAFDLIRSQDSWRVDPSSFIENLVSFIPPDELARMEAGYPDRLLRSRLKNCMRGAGDLDRVRDLLQKDVPQSVLNSALRDAVNDFRFRNQFEKQSVNSSSYVITKLLLETGADSNAIESSRDPLLGEAVGIQRYSNVEIVKLLLDNGADINGRIDGGKTPLMFAVMIPSQFGNNGEVVCLLLERGADLSIVDGMGFSVFDHVKFNNDDSYKKLLEEYR